MIWNSNEGKCMFGNDINTVSDSKLNGVSIIEFVKADFDKSLNLLLLYQKMQ